MRNETLMDLYNQILMTWYFVDILEHQILTAKLTNKAVVNILLIIN